MSLKLSLFALVALLAAAIWQQRTHRPTPPVSSAAPRSPTWVASDGEVDKPTPP